MEKIKLNIQLFASNGCTVTVKSITQDIVNNKSTITIHGKLTTGSSSYNYGGAYMQPTISNQPVVGSQTSSQTLSKKKYSIGTNGTKEDDWTFVVYHNSDGACPTLTIKIKWYISDSTNGTATLSGGYKPTTIPRASSVNANNGELNTSLTISIDRKNESFTHTLRYVCGSVEGWIKDINNKVGTSATWTPPLSLANQNQSGNSVSCRIYCQTYNGSTVIGSETYKDITLSIPTMNPTASLASVTDSNSYKNTYGVFIQNKSKIHTTLSGTPQYTTINTYSWQIRKNNSSGTLLASGSSANIDYTPIESGTLYISGTVKDKRGNSGSTSTTVSITAYSIPKCSLAVSRTDSTSASYTATGSGTVIDNINYTKNEVTYILKRGSTNINSWNGSSLNQLGTDSISDQSYTYTLTAQDTISGITDTKVVTISTTFTLMNFNSTGYAMAIGKASEATGTTKLLEIAMPTKHTDNIEISKSSGDSYCRAKRTDTNVAVDLLVGTGGTNHGLYSRKLDKWMIYGDDNDVWYKKVSYENNDGQTIYPLCSDNAGGIHGKLYTTSGLSIWHKQGTTSATGRSELVLGNNIASGTNGNKDGTIRLFTTGTGSNYIARANNGHNNTRWNYLPDKDGTLLVEDDIFYKSGDVIELGAANTSMYVVNGIITSSTKSIRLTIITPKRLDKISTITCNNCNVEARTQKGYLNSANDYHDFKTTSGYTIDCYKSSNNAITVWINKSSAYTNVDNNTLVAMNGYFKFTLS